MKIRMLVAIAASASALALPAPASAEVEAAPCGDGVGVHVWSTRYGTIVAGCVAGDSCLVRIGTATSYYCHPY